MTYRSRLLIGFGGCEMELRHVMLVWVLY